MTETTTDNDKPRRKQLSDQLDRLDGILDALGEGLNEAVTDAAREGTRLAVKDAIGWYGSRVLGGGINPPSR
jgi:hypothetical protein